MAVKGACQLPLVAYSAFSAKTHHPSIKTPLLEACNGLWRGLQSFSLSSSSSLFCWDSKETVLKLHPIMTLLCLKLSLRLPMALGTKSQIVNVVFPCQPILLYLAPCWLSCHHVEQSEVSGINYECTGLSLSRTPCFFTLTWLGLPILLDTAPT